jgi:hypothetical protein
MKKEIKIQTLPNKRNEERMYLSKNSIWSQERKMKGMEEEKDRKRQISILSETGVFALADIAEETEEKKVAVLPKPCLACFSSIAPRRVCENASWAVIMIDCRLRTL